MICFSASMLRFLPVLLCVSAGLPAIAQDAPGTVSEGMKGSVVYSTTGDKNPGTLKSAALGIFDPNRASSIGGKKFEGNGSFALREVNMGKDSFAVSENKMGKGFQTREFLGIKNPWFGKKVFSTGDAPLWAKSLPTKVDQAYEVKTEETKDFYQAGKEMPLRSNPVATETKPFLGKGSAQGAMDLMTEKVKKEMTVDEVRELLNKNR